MVTPKQGLPGRYISANDSKPAVIRNNAQPTDTTVDVLRMTSNGNSPSDGVPFVDVGATPPAFSKDMGGYFQAIDTAS